MTYIFYDCITYLIVSVQIVVVAVLVLLLIYCGKKLKRRRKTKIVSQISNSFHFINIFIIVFFPVIMPDLGKCLCCRFLQFSILNGKDLCTTVIFFFIILCIQVTEKVSKNQVGSNVYHHVKPFPWNVFLERRYTELKKLTFSWLCNSSPLYILYEWQKIYDEKIDVIG